MANADFYALSLRADRDRAVELVAPVMELLDTAAVISGSDPVVFRYMAAIQLLRSMVDHAGYTPDELADAVRRWTGHDGDEPGVGRC